MALKRELVNKIAAAAYVPPKYPYDANLHKMLSAYETQQNAVRGARQQPSPITPETLAALNAYLSGVHKTPENMAMKVKPVLPARQQPDDLDAIETLMELEDVAPKVKKVNAMNTKQSMRKAAKVYEAGESVEGNKPKVVYESHKECTPCEFGARVKESAGLMGANPAAAHADQAALNTNYMHGLRDSGLLSGQEHYAPMSTAMSKDPAILNRIGHAQLPTRGSELLGGTGPNAALGRLTRDATDDTAQTFRNVRQQYQPRPAAGMTKTQSAFNFGARVKEANTMQALQALLGLGGAGAGVGALVGAARAPKGKRLRTAIGDAAVGGTAGVGFGLGAMGGGRVGPSFSEGSPSEFGAGLGGGLTGVGAGALAHKIRNEMEEDYDNNNSPLLNAIAKQGAADDIRIPTHWPKDDTSDKVPLSTSTAVGAGLGGLIGALRAPKGKMLKYTLGGAGIGGLSGLGSGVGYNLLNFPAAGTPAGDTNGASMLRATRLPLALGGGALAGHLGNKLYDEVEHHIPEKKDKKEKQSALSHEGVDAVGLGMTGGLAGGMYGGLAGLAGGGLHGAIDPGHTMTHDDKGNVTGQKRRNRLLGALRGSLGYGALGAGVGATVGSVGGLAVENAAPGTFRRVVGNANWKDIHDAKANSDMEQGIHAAARQLNGWIEKRQSAREFGQKMAYEPAGRGYSFPNELTNKAQTTGQFYLDDKDEQTEIWNSPISAVRDFAVPKTVGAVTGLMGGQAAGRLAEGATGAALAAGQMAHAGDLRLSRADFLRARQAANNTTGAPAGSYTGKRPVNFVPDYKSQQEINQHRDALLGARSPAVPNATNAIQNSAMQPARDIFKAQPATPAPLPKPTPAIKAGAFTFGQKVAFNVDLSMLKNPAIGGAAVGALAGGVHGLISPGEDEKGNQRSRFGAMLRGAGVGGAIGGVGGAAAGHFAPDMTKKMVGSARAAMDPANYQEPVAAAMGRPLPPNMQIPQHFRDLYNAAEYGI